jgi:hypothetical protein
MGVTEAIAEGLALGLYPAQIDRMHGYRQGFTARKVVEMGMAERAKRNYQEYVKCAAKGKQAAARERLRESLKAARLRYGIDPRQQLRDLREAGLAPRRGYRGPQA